MPSVAELLTKLFLTQYCSTPAALAGLIDLMSGSAEISEGADNWAEAAEQAHPSIAIDKADLRKFVIGCPSEGIRYLLAEPAAIRTNRY